MGWEMSVALRKSGGAKMGLIFRGRGTVRHGRPATISPNGNAFEDDQQLECRVSAERHFLLMFPWAYVYLIIQIII
jgi:hypothetical protein